MEVTEGLALGFDCRGSTKESGPVLESGEQWHSIKQWVHVAAVLAQ